MPSRRDIDRGDITGDARDCTGEDPLPGRDRQKKLGVDVIVAGTVGQLGDNYVLTIKAVDVAGRGARPAEDPERSAARPARRADRGRPGSRPTACSRPDQLHGAIPRSKTGT